MLLTRRLYYHLKPLIPARLRVMMRRYHVHRILRGSADIWPIRRGSESPPEGWPGWPDGRRFAIVLTHDVESQRGVDRVKRLAEVELEFGFRSSFNFIPEGDYVVPRDLRAWLVDRGFEIGVHDLHHDGKLYSDKKSFLTKAERINYYLRDWNAVGFRSAFMLHNYNWLHALNVAYDASSFDTDPFEPQPDGVNTIFPFWVPRRSSADPNGLLSADVVGEQRDPRSAINHSPSLNSRPSTLIQPRSGYVELPYTLPQDSTLFKFLQLRNIDVWKRKLDWIVEKKGMALLNLHPDYVSFDHSSRSRTEFSIQRYREFLGYLNARYHEDAWKALPYEVADFCRVFTPVRTTRRSKNICMLAYSAYESDARIVRYAQTLTKRGDHVDVIGYADGTDVLGEKDVDGVRLFKIQRRLRRGTNGPLGHLWPLLRFFTLASILICRRHFQRHYDLIHVHNIPEWLVFAAILPRLFGARILLDIHDLVPELFTAKFRTPYQSLILSLLRAIERWSCKFADHVIISNHLWQKRLVRRSVPASKCTVFFNNIDPDLFYSRERTRDDARKIVLFPGSLQWHQGVDVAISAFPRVLERCPTAEFHIYGTGGVINDLKQLIKRLGVEKEVLFCPPVPVGKIPQLLANADAGVVPKRNDPFGNEAYSTKIMEFMSQGIPVVLSRTAIDSYYFDDSQVRFCQPGDPDSFADGLIDVLTDETIRERLVRNSMTYVAQNHWGTRKQDYFDLVDTLIGGVDAEIDLASRTLTSPKFQEGAQEPPPRTLPTCLNHD
jgi:glycosyltransferase involved in cell wall biosynthesis